MVQAFPVTNYKKKGKKQTNPNQKPKWKNREGGGTHQVVKKCYLVK